MACPSGSVAENVSVPHGSTPHSLYSGLSGPTQPPIAQSLTARTYMTVSPFISANVAMMLSYPTAMKTTPGFES